jgi:hypothetical protein
MRTFTDFINRSRLSFQSIRKALSLMNPFTGFRERSPEPAQVPERLGQWNKVDKKFHAKRKKRNKTAAESRRVNFRKAAAAVILAFAFTLPAFAQDEEARNHNQYGNVTRYTVFENGCMIAVKSDHPIRPHVYASALACPVEDDPYRSLVKEEDEIYKGMSFKDIREWRGMVSVTYRTNVKRHCSWENPLNHWKDAK